MFVKQSEEKVSQMLVIAKKFKEILNPEHQNTVWRVSQGVSSHKSKNCVKMCQARGKKPKNHYKIVR